MRVELNVRTPEGESLNFDLDTDAAGSTYKVTEAGTLTITKGYKDSEYKEQWAWPSHAWSSLYANTIAKVKVEDY